MLVGKQRVQALRKAVWLFGLWCSPAVALSDHVIQVSQFSDRQSAVRLDASVVSGNVAIFLSPEDGADVGRVIFYLDGGLKQAENVAPFDFNGTASSNDAILYDSTQLPDGTHQVEAIIELTSGQTESAIASFGVLNNGPSLIADPADVNLGGNLASPSIAEAQVSLSTSNGLPSSFQVQVTSDTPWLSATPSSQETPHTIVVSADPTLGGEGLHKGMLRISDTNGSFAPISVDVTFGVTDVQFTLMTSALPGRENPVPLDGSILSGDAYIHVVPETGVSEVQFFLNDPSMFGAPRQTERRAPFDFAGTASDGSALPFNTGSLLDATHNISAVITLDSGIVQEATSDFLTQNSSASNIPPEPVISFSCSGLTCNFDASGSSDSDGSILSYQWDLGDGATAAGVTATHTFVTAGTYTVSLTVTDDDGDAAATTLNVSVSTANVAPSADFTFSCTALECAFDATSSTDNDGTIVSYSWTFGDNSSSSGAVTSHLYQEPGIFEVALQVTDDAGAVGTATKTISVSSGAGCSYISSLDCSQIRKTDDFFNSFDASAGGLLDRNGVGTGFTMADPPSFAGNPVPNPDVPGLWADQLEIEIQNGVITLETTSGIMYSDNNSQDNALGVGLNLPSSAITLTSTLLEPPAPGGWAQGGLWLGGADNFGRGTVQDNHVKLVVASPSNGELVIQAALEKDGLQVSEKSIALPSGVANVDLVLFADPISRSIQARYNTGAGETILETFSGLPDAWFSFDQAGIDPAVATRSFGGIFATHRRAASAQTYRFSDFGVEKSSTNVGGPVDLQFSEWSVGVESPPTAIEVGPDDRVYVATLFGTIYALTLDHENHSVLSQQVIDVIPRSLGSSRLTLGLAIDPGSTPNNVVLWVSHSDGSLNNGQENSGMLSKVSGPDFLDVAHVVTGLPRAIANHAINNIGFGPDGRLYIAAGGNTGAGAPNTEPSEFGDRPEQPLSAAILVADVNAKGFEGDCATPIGQFGIPETCDVEVYASGFRNSYDFAWHGNGNLYATDNGLGVVGTVPPATEPPCTGFADAEIHNPGPQPDLLQLVVQGQYYGHPNPYRDECVFKDGTFQGADPLINYRAPMHVLGSNLSANGIIEYQSEAFFSKLLGRLLITNFSVGDDVTSITLSDSGEEVIFSESLIDGFTDPLPIAQDAKGRLYVGEMNALSLAVLEPQPVNPEPAGGWLERKALPESILDAGSAVLDGKLYVVAGKTSSAYLNSMYIYDPLADDWTTGPPLPGPGVENPSLVAHQGRLYAFGGSTAPFSGAVSNAAVFDPELNQWMSITSMDTARSGAVARVVDDEIYVVGGMSADGESLASVEIYYPPTDSWSTGIPMNTRRDNPGAAVFGSKLFIFGGRTRNSDGSVDADALSSLEIFDPTQGAWSYGASMPTPRRTMVVGTISGRAQVVGGESPATAVNEEYDPATDTWRSLTPMATPRHGAAGGTIRGKLYVIGGGEVAGSSFTNLSDVFAY